MAAEATLQKGLEKVSTTLDELAGRFDDEVESLTSAARAVQAAAELSSQYGLDAERLSRWLRSTAEAAQRGATVAPLPALQPTWLVRAKAEIGTREWAGKRRSNPRVEQYQEATVQRETGDHIPWCSAYICWLFEQEGIRSPRDARARKWLQWGRPVMQPSLGAVAVFWRGKRDNGYSGHVGLWLAEDKERILLHGGNQRNRVSEVWYPKSRLLGYRLPALEPA